MPKLKLKNRKGKLIERKPPKRAGDLSPIWQLLRGQIGIYVEAAIADSWKGGGDPADFDIKELRCKLELATLEAIIAKMERQYGPPP